MSGRGAQGGRVWLEYAAIAQALATIVPALGQMKPQQLRTTKEMAERLRVSSKTLLRRKRRGELEPAIQVGKLIRWRDTLLDLL